MALTPKQRAFIAHYFECGMNASEAARRAGYKTRQSAAENMSNPVIREEIERIFKERLISPDEVLARLSEHAKGDIGEIWDEDSGQIDWEKSRLAGKTGLIKRFRHKTTRITNEKTGEDTEIFEDEIELHDPQKALQLIGKYHKLFVDRQEITGKDGQPIEVKTYTNFTPDDWDKPEV